MSLASRSDHDSDHPHWEAAVSAWVDGEETVRAEELDTPYGRQLWDTYHLIGDVLRSEDLAIQPDDLFYARVSRAIDDEPVVVAPSRRGLGRLRRGASGVAAAAVAASVAWVVMLYLPDSASTTPEAAPGGQQLAVSTDAETTEDLHEYMDAHQNLAGTIPVKLASYAGASR